MLLDFIKAKIEPKNNNLETKSLELYSIENITIKINEEKISKIKSDTKHFNQDLKSPMLERVEIHKMAKGETKTNTLIKIYLIEQINIKFKKPIEEIVFKIPSTDNTEFSSPSIGAIELSKSERFLKHMLE